jgi:hypothetical protein
MKKEKVELFYRLVSEIDISKYNQKKFIEIVNAELIFLMKYLKIIMKDNT